MNSLLRGDLFQTAPTNNFSEFYSYSRKSPSIPCETTEVPAHCPFPAIILQHTQIPNPAAILQTYFVV